MTYAELKAQRELGDEYIHIKDGKFVNNFVPFDERLLVQDMEADIDNELLVITAGDKKWPLLFNHEECCRWCRYFHMLTGGE